MSIRWVIKDWATGEDIVMPHPETALNRKGKTVGQDMDQTDGLRAVIKNCSTLKLHKADHRG